MTKMTWRKSSYSSSQGDNCIELADLGGVVGVRDSKDPDGPHLRITRNTLHTLITNLKR
ncbi:DUF397 domain-containing protein [Actinomadura chibensis]|uniref:DUF397 domain-containing protein n=2 Tax=Actinomadura chibensis TaxID=392828 RepID=A0A5D0NYL6_9ACTN|nr:DUF397 domain-containing protein [Actinomadura chibensis]TYB49244.1 DUF397 domain-containing protein [Actinomadura chibensis]